jgi:hypothetical protein
VLRHRATSAEGMEITASADGSTPAWKDTNKGSRGQPAGYANQLKQLTKLLLLQHS